MFRFVFYTADVFEHAVESVLSLAREWGLAASIDVAERIVRFLCELLRWNERLNVTGARSLGELCGDHLPDSFAISRLCPEGADLVDVGSGGGLPGLPFSMLRPDCRVTLVEPRAKRVAFLRAALREFGSSSVSVLRARAEELVMPRYSVAVSRATFKAESWVEMASGLLAPEGLAVVLSTCRPSVWNVRAKLVGAFEYRTASGAPRWSGSYCFT